MDQLHHLAAILFTDIVGFTSLMQEDEEKALQAVRNHNDVIMSSARKYNGEVANYYGDGCLVIFVSAINALECAIDIQNTLRATTGVPVRMGLHLGEIIEENGKVLGDGVNIASRVQSLGVDNSILLSSHFYDSIKNHSEYQSVSLGTFHFKNVKKRIEVFALTNEGFNIPKKGYIHGKLQRDKSQFLRYFLFAIIAVTMIGILSYKYQFGDGAQIQNKSIAVLAFRDMSESQDQQYFSDGMAEEILNALCKFKDLKVAARTSSFTFKNKNEDIETIGKKLKVANILEGSVRKNPDKVIVTVRLTNADNGFTLLSESYSDVPENIYSLQSTIALDIASKIGMELSLGEKKLLTRKKISPAAYDTYLKGRSQFINGPLNMQAGEIYRAKEYFESAVEQDSAFAEAMAYLSLTYFNLADWAIPHSQGEKRKTVLDSAMMLARKSLALDSLNSGAHLAMGSYYFHQYNWIQAEKEKRKAVQLNPGGSEEKFILASFLAQFGQPEEALQLDREAIALDPLEPNNKLKYSRDLYRAGEFDEAIRQCNLLLEEKPNSPGAYQFLNMCYHAKKQYPEAKETMLKFQELNGSENLAEIYRSMDYFSATKEYIRILTDSIPVEEQPHMKLAFLYASIGNKDGAFRNLDRAYNERIPTISFIWHQPNFFVLRDDPRYNEFLEKAGFKAYQEYKNKEKKLSTE